MQPQHAALVALALLLTACGKDEGSKNADPNGDPNNGFDVSENNDAGNNNSSNGDVGSDDTGGADMGGSDDMTPPVGDELVDTTGGTVAGVDEDGIATFKGIPYAEPPTGDRRFRPPVAHGGWNGTLDASAYGPLCPQRNAETMQPVGDEDCLQLNVWAPKDSQGLPVMFFIHGGGFVQGSGTLPLYDGHNLAAMGNVVVTINYRLGPLGYLAADELAVESADDTAGNYGMLDQVLALEWVRDNIAAFGGDPGNVTIFGESAGGVSVCGHLGSQMSEGLFARGIIESGSGCGNFSQLRTGTLTSDPAVMTGAQFVAAAGCAGAVDVPQCLRDLPAANTVTVAWSLTATGLGLPPFGMIIDGSFLTQQPIEAVRNGDVTDVPVITGSNADEATIFTATTPVPTVNAYETAVRTIFGTTLGNQVLTVYPASDFATPKAAYNALFGDVAFVCPALRFAGVAAEGAQPAYTYHFTRVLPGVLGVAGAFHGLELFYVFGSFDAAPNYVPDDDDLAIRDAMMTAWSTFAGGSAAPWPAHDRLAPQIQIFDNPTSVVAQIREGRCIELEAIGALP